MDQRQFGTHNSQAHDQAGEFGEGGHQAQEQSGDIYHKKNKPVEEVQVASDDSFELAEDKNKIQAKMNAKAKASPQP